MKFYMPRAIWENLKECEREMWRELSRDVATMAAMPHRQMIFVPASGVILIAGPFEGEMMNDKCKMINWETGPAEAGTPNS